MIPSAVRYHSAPHAFPIAPVDSPSQVVDNSYPLTTC